MIYQANSEKEAIDYCIRLALRGQEPTAHTADHCYGIRNGDFVGHRINCHLNTDWQNARLVKFIYFDDAGAIIEINEF